MASRAMTRPGNEGMLPLYDMARGFSHAVIPTVFLDALEEYGFDDALSHWQDILVGMMGFLVCLLIGILFVLCMPVGGCVTCCCRTCCCGKKKSYPSKYKRISCTVHLGIITTLMFSAVVCSYVSLTQLRYEVSPQGFLQDIVNGFENAERFVQETGTGINDVAVVGLRDTADDITEELENLADNSIDDLATEAGIQPALDEMIAFVNGLDSLHSNLEQMNDSRANLMDLHATLDSELATSRASLYPLLAGCAATDPLCDSAHTDLADLVPEADFSTAEDVGPYITALDVALSTGIVDDMNSAVDSLNNASQAVDDELRTEIDGAIDSLNDFVGDTTNQVGNLTYNWMTFTLSEITDSVKGSMDSVDQYGGYAVIGMHILTSICLFITVFNILAIVFGIIGSTGTLKHGANLLIASAAFMFIFGWLVMLITVVTFASGSLMEGAACRHLVNPGDTLTQFVQLAEESDVIELPESIQNISILDSLSGCKDNETIYQVLDVEENFGINMDDIVNNALEEAEDILEELKGTDVDVPEITIITDDMATVLLTLYSQLVNINFKSYQYPLSQPNTKISIPEYVITLNKIADRLTDPTAKQIRDEADTLSGIEDTTIKSMDDERKVMEEAVTDAEVFIDESDVPGLVIQLNESQIYFNSEANNMIGTSINDTVDAIYLSIKSFLKSAVYSIENEIGHCRSLYDAVSDLVFGPCVYFLNPYQAVWFTYGWFLGIGIVSMGFLFAMADMYRAMAENKKVHPIKYDAEEDIQLEDSKTSVVPPI